MSMDSQARTTTDPARPVRVGVGDGYTTVFDTPFLEATTLKGFVDGTEVTGTALLRASGADDTDQIRFTAAPAAGTIVSVSANGTAINLVVLDQAIEQAEMNMKGAVQSAGYAWPVTGDALDIVTSQIVSEVTELLRLRRGLDVPRNAAGRTPQEQWRYDLATGKFRLPSNTPADSVSTPQSGLAHGSYRPVFTGAWL